MADYEEWFFRFELVLIGVGVVVLVVILNA